MTRKKEEALRQERLPYSVDKKDIKNIKVEGLILSGKKYESCRENVIKAVIRGMFSGNMA